MSCPNSKTPSEPAAVHAQPTEVTVSVVILTWNSEQQIAACLASLTQGLGAFSAEVIVIDNGSQDRTCAVIHKTLPGVRLVRNTTNRGVAPARNQGIRLARGQYIVLLDDDTIVQPGALDSLIHYMNTRPEVGICGPKLTAADGGLQFSCRLFPTLSDKLARRLPSAAAQNIARVSDMADWDHNATREVDYVIGACQVVRHSALRTVGMLDEHIFYGPEDIDLCLRLQQAGWRVVYKPDAVVMHEERRMTNSVWSGLTWKHMWSVGYFFWKHGYLLSRKKPYARIARSRARSQVRRQG